MGLCGHRPTGDPIRVSDHTSPHPPPPIPPSLPGRRVRGCQPGRDAVRVGHPQQKGRRKRAKDLERSERVSGQRGAAREAVAAFYLPRVEWTARLAPLAPHRVAPPPPHTHTHTHTQSVMKKFCPNAPRAAVCVEVVLPPPPPPSPHAARDEDVLPQRSARRQVRVGSGRLDCLQRVSEMGIRGGPPLPSPLPHSYIASE